MLVPAEDPVAATLTKLTLHPLVTVEQFTSGPDAATIALPVSWLMPTPVGPCPTDKGLCGSVVPVVRSTRDTVALPLFVTIATSRSGSTATLEGRFPTTTGCTTV